MSTSKRGQGRANRETLADIERMIAEQLPTMPPKLQEDEPQGPYTSPHVVRMNPRGRRVVRKAKRV